MSIVSAGMRHLDPLTPDTALSLMAQERVGRLAFCLHGAPHIEVVNFVLVDGDPVFRIGVGAKLMAVGRGGPFALQCDHINAGTRTGWTVTVQGPGRILKAAEVADLPLQPESWAPGERARVVRMTTRQVFGRMLSVDE
jgi:nitroimidazol reductase NimA-like FMN-containing flavoprotein (pyridoxamine 5'-phosphate oxidase superfamily)